jgi:hypothetical protein
VVEVDHALQLHNDHRRGVKIFGQQPPSNSMARMENFRWWNTHTHHSQSHHYTDQAFQNLPYIFRYSARQESVFMTIARFQSIGWRIISNWALTINLSSRPDMRHIELSAHSSQSQQELYEHAVFLDCIAHERNSSNFKNSKHIIAFLFNDNTFTERGKLRNLI